MFLYLFTFLRPHFPYVRFFIIIITIIIIIIIIM